MVIEGEFPSIHLNVLTTGGDLLIHQQVRGAGLGFGNEKPLVSELVLPHLLFHMPPLARREAGALLGDSPEDGLLKSDIERTITGSSFHLLTAKERVKTWKEGDQTHRSCGPGSLCRYFEAELKWTDRVSCGALLTVLILALINMPSWSKKIL